MLKIAFFGSPTFALPVLEMLYKHHKILLVVSQPDKPVGRGYKLTPPPVAIRAKELGLKLWQPDKLKKNQGFAQLLESLKLDVAVTAAYGKILPKYLLDIPKHGFLNVHASLLPKYRGAAPIQWALINGEVETGVTIMQTAVGMDTGDIRLVKKIALDFADNALTLFEKLANLGVEALSEALEKLEQNQLPATMQNEKEATHAPMLKKEDGQINWRDSATSIYNRYRGVYVWPGSFTTFRGKLLKVKELLPMDKTGTAGTILDISANGVVVAAGEEAILLKIVQPSGKKAMSAWDWVNGYKIEVGQFLETS